MKTVGIIAEYNPFHNGHAYQMRKIRERLGADTAIIAIMSGCFTQRGLPAITDKFTRAHMALLGGADLVLELPVAWATASAEYFASGGVSVLRATGIADALCFGTEASAEELTALKRIATLLLNEPDEMKEGIKQAQKSGISYPAARAAALADCLGQDIASLLDTPNNILAVEYLKALERDGGSASGIEAIAIPRIGDDYHSRKAASSYASATAIRSLLEQTLPSPAAAPANFAPSRVADTGMVEMYMPSDCLAVLTQAAGDGLLVDEDAFSSALGYRLAALLHNDSDLIRFADCSKELASRIRAFFPQYCGMCSFAEYLKSKDLTQTRIRRALLHILLDITNEQVALSKDPNYLPYLRVLGFRRGSGEMLLHRIKSLSRAARITKLSDCSTDHPLLKQDLFAGNLYAQQQSIRNGRRIQNELTHPLVIVE